MTVRRIGGNEAGYRLLVLESDEYMQNVTMLRQQSADVVFASYSGLRVPKDAVRVNENGKTGVYILEGPSPRWKPINILHDNGESYVAALDKSFNEQPLARRRDHRRGERSIQWKGSQWIWNRTMTSAQMSRRSGEDGRSGAELRPRPEGDQASARQRR